MRAAHAEASVGGGKHGADHHCHHGGAVKLLRRAAWQALPAVQQPSGGQERDLTRSITAVNHMEDTAAPAGTASGPLPPLNLPGEVTLTAVLGSTDQELDDLEEDLRPADKVQQDHLLVTVREGTQALQVMGDEASVFDLQTSAMLDEACASGQTAVDESVSLVRKFPLHASLHGTLQTQHAQQQLQVKDAPEVAVKIMLKVLKGLQSDEDVISQ